MTKEVLETGFIKLTSETGLVDSRYGSVHHTVICSEETEKYFEELEAQT